MRFLLDTNAWLWMIGPADRLAAPAKKILADPANELFLSAVSVWEIAIKHAIKKIRFPGSPAVYIPQAIERSGIRTLAVEARHALRLMELPMHHRDPFDRMLVAQAQVEGLSIVTADRRMAAYDVQVVQADA